jgi:predicted transcriptional regulator
MEDICGDDVLCSILGLRELQTRIYWLLVEKDMEISEIAGAVERDRSSVQRAVNDLISLGLVTRRPKPMKRGRKYVYKGISKQKLKQKLNHELDTYYRKVKKEIQQI